MKPSVYQGHLTSKDHQAFVRRMLLVPGLFLSGVLILMLVGWQGGGAWLNEAEQTVKVQERQLTDVLESVRFLQEQRRLVQQYGPAYQKLLNEGLVQRQDRVDWTDHLLQVQKRWQLSPFVVQYEPRQALTKSLAGPFPWEEDLFRFTRLHIEAGVHTESDLQALFDQVASALTPLFLVEGCNLSQRVSKVLTPEQAVRFSPNRSALIAQCTLLLFEAELPPFETGALQ
jgi:hypothetical protein